MLGIGLPLTIWSVQQTIRSRSEAETVTVTATVAKTPYNTPDYATNGNQPPTIEGDTEINFTVGKYMDFEFHITDPDWIRGQTPPKVVFTSRSQLPPKLKLTCFSFGNNTYCRIYGTLTNTPPKTTQPVTITATDHYQAKSKQIIKLQYQN
jgi:hypothetical protein